MSTFERILFLPFVVLLVAATTASAQGEIHIDSSCSLADAITAANTDREQGGCPAGNGADVINLVEPVTLLAALPSITSEITIEGFGNSISGDGQYRLFHVDSDGELTVNNATLEEGWSADDGKLNLIGDGGAILNQGILRVNQCVLRNNQAGEDGGAIRNVGEAHISGSRFLGNTANRQSGAIYSAGASATDSEIATLDINSSIFTKNSSSRHAGAIFIDGSARIDSSIFSGNSAGISGGAIYNVGTTEVRRTDLRGNTSQLNGGAIFNDLGACILVSKSDLRYNSTVSDGGGLYVFGGGRAVVTESRLHNNSASEGGGLLIRSFLHDDDIYIGGLHMGDTAIWDNDGGDCFYADPVNVIYHGSYGCGDRPFASDFHLVSYPAMYASIEEDHWYIKRVRCR